MMDIIKALAILAFLTCAAACWNRQQKTEAEPVEEAQDMSQYMPDIKVGSPAPAIELNTPDGTPVALSDFAGKWTVLDFWASWCPDCRAEFPAVKEFYEAYAPKGVEILGISFDTDAEAWKKCLDEQGFAWPQGSNLIKWKEGNPVSEAYGVHWIPTMVLVAPDGTVAGAALTAEDMKALLDSKLKQ